MGRASAKDDSRDGRAANDARLSLAIVDLMDILEASGLAVRVAIIPKRAAAMADGAIEDGLDASVQSGDLRRGKLIGRDARVDAGGEEGFVGINITHSGEYLLIQKCGFNRAAGFCKLAGELSRSETERFGSQSGIGGSVRPEPEDAAKSAGIDKADFARGDLQDQMRMWPHREAGRIDGQSAAHAEMNKKAICIV